MKRRQPRTVVSLFTGAGGLDIGLEAAGFETRVAVEMDKDAVRTLKANRDWPVIDRDLRTVSSARLLDKAGLLGGWLYGAGVYATFFFVRHDYKTLPPGDLLFVLIGVPVLLLMAKPILEFFLHHRKEGKRFSLLTPVDWIMEWIVELLEIFSGYLANTLSFMRVAGLGIAHVSLMVAFFEIARMIGGGGFTVWSYLILVLGNTLVIALEGLSAGIQSLRLNYYEFFSKYFSGSGLAYTPVSLHNKNM